MKTRCPMCQDKHLFSSNLYMVITAVFFVLQSSKFGFTSLVKLIKYIFDDRVLL